MITTNGLNHLALPVPDPQRSAQFYAELLGMEITSSSPDAVFLKTVGSWDMIALTRSDAPASSSRSGLHFGFRVTPEQFDAALEVIENHFVNDGATQGTRSTGRFVFFEDLDGYTLEIFECLTPPFA